MLQYVPINSYHVSLPHLLLEFITGVWKIMSIPSAICQFHDLPILVCAELQCNAQCDFAVTNLLLNTY